MNKLTNDNVRREVNAIEAAMKQAPQVELPVQHYFSPGVYARYLFIPAGVILVGKIHKYENLNILAQGKIAVLIDNRVKEIQAPFVVVSPPGTKRIAKAITDCVWITVLGTEEKDHEIIDKLFTASNEQEYLDFIKDNQLALAI